MEDKTIITNDKCIYCSKNLRSAGNYHNQAHYIACSYPYFFYEWNESKHFEKSECCNLCYYAREFLCCQKENKICSFHKRFSKIEKIEILSKIGLLNYY